ncbi:MAG: GNAT family N-acetyltransferase [Succinivibrionaceae bacterium]|nr:GNAT family N-acetyltransferase [Succinivibrionaceae bacterium]
MEISLVPLGGVDRERFVRDNQAAFNHGALVEFGARDDHFEEEGQIISAATINAAIDHGMAFRILEGREIAGGMVLRVEGERGSLDLLFVDPSRHGRGIGQAAWRKAEQMFPTVRIWETVTPYFERRNLHFYINCLGFHAVEFFNLHHPDPHDPSSLEDSPSAGAFRFEKVIAP